MGVGGEGERWREWGKGEGIDKNEPAVGRAVHQLQSLGLGRGRKELGTCDTEGFWGSIRSGTLMPAHASVR